MADPTPRPQRDTLVLSLGLPRTGSYSIATALTLLGYKDVYHGVDYMASTHDWSVMASAADALFPSLPTYTGAGSFPREKWDTIFGHCEAVTDVAAVFATSLIEAYPEAKIILVHRDFDKWSKSVDKTIIGTTFSRLADFAEKVIDPLRGVTTTSDVRKIILGWTGARDVQGMRANYRKVYDAHYEAVTSAAPPERILHYRMGDGWEPLCEFLGKDVPDVEFPRTNEVEALMKKVLQQHARQMVEAGRVVAPYAVGLGAVAAAWWVWR